MRMCATCGVLYMWMMQRHFGEIMQTHLVKTVKVMFASCGTPFAYICSPFEIVSALIEMAGPVPFRTVDEYR